MDRHWHALSAGETAHILGVDPDLGLAPDEAARRLAAHGRNELAREEQANPLLLFLGQFKNVLILILLAAIVLSALVGETTDAVIIAVIVIFCAVLGFVQEYRAEKALEALRRMLSPEATVLRGGSPVRIDSRDVAPGDVLLLEAGDRIPADARILEAHALRCDEAPLTGESAPVGKTPRPLPEGLGTADQENMVFTGATVTYGRGRAVVTATAMDTAFGRIAREVAAVKAEKTPLEKRTAEIGVWLGVGSMAICALVAGISVWRRYGAGPVDLPFVVDVVMFAVALAVAAVPEALAAIVTGALAIGMREMAKNNALVRKMPAVETLGCTTVICTDKTGTLTRGEMTVRRLLLASGEIEVTGGGYAPVGELLAPSGPIRPRALPRDLETFFTCAVLCNDADLAGAEGKWGIRGDPTEAALVVAAAKAGIARTQACRACPRLDELPFSSERKRMTTIHDLPGMGRAGLTKGAPEMILARCERILDGDAARDLTPADRAAILRGNEAMAGQALRVLALAYVPLADPAAPVTEEAVERDMVFLGLAGMMDPPRPEAAKAVAVCRSVGIRPVMITGDHALTARAVAAEIGIWREGEEIMTGEELSRLTPEAFAARVDRISVYARVSPMDKLAIVKAWKARGEVVAMTGDGVNDAPALKHADIGVAMGVSGTEVAREAADMVLTDDNFATIVTAIGQGRWIYDNIKKYLAFLIQCNLTEVAVIGGVVLALGPDYLPLLPAAILYINLATDGLPALALGVAPPDPDIMLRPPRDPKESVFSRDVTAFIVRALLIEIPFFFFLFFHDLGDMTHARTEIFFLFIIVEVVIALNCRSLRYSVFTAPPHKWLVAAVVWELLLIFALMQSATIREAFGITMPSAADLTVIILFSALIFAIMELTKYLLRRRPAHPA